MAELRPQVTRTLSILSAMCGWYFTISEGEMVYIESPIFDVYELCVEEGIKHLDAFHEKSPIRSDYIPTAADFMFLVKKEEKKDENG